MKDKLKAAYKDGSVWLAVVCFLIGSLWLLGLRFILTNKHDVHYHANFAVYINGEREQFDNFAYYEEIQACFDSNSEDPRARVHMHDNVNHVVHVHDNAATWGHFFANLGFSLGPNFIQTDKGIFKDGDNGKKLTFWLNGKAISSPYNTIIESEDVLLISYGNETSDQLQQQYSTIEQDSHDYNVRNDPSSCSGGKPFTLKEKFLKTLKFWE